MTTVKKTSTTSAPRTKTKTHAAPIETSVVPLKQRNRPKRICGQNAVIKSDMLRLVKEHMSYTSNKRSRETGKYVSETKGIRCSEGAITGLIELVNNFTAKLCDNAIAFTQFDNRRVLSEKDVINAAAEMGYTLLDENIDVDEKNTVQSLAETKHRIIDKTAEEEEEEEEGEEEEGEEEDE